MLNLRDNGSDQAVSQLELPSETWSKALSYFLRSNLCAAPLRVVSKSFAQFVSQPLCWEGASVCIGPADLEGSQSSASSRRPTFEKLLPACVLSKEAFIDFDGCHRGPQRASSGECFTSLGTSCTQLVSLCVQNWMMCEKIGLAIIRDSFPRLRHLELRGCDTLSTYDSVIPVFERHPQLLSFRASFVPRASAGVAFSKSAPKSLMMLGFVNFESTEALTELLERCQIEHLWFSATGSFSSGLASAISASSSSRKLKTLSLPSTVAEDTCSDAASQCSTLDLLCRMRIGNPAFGTGALADRFEALPSSQGVVVRRRGSKADLAVNGSLWSPYSQIAMDLPKLRASVCSQVEVSRPQPKRETPPTIDAMSKASWVAHWQRKGTDAFAAALARERRRLRQSN